MIKNNSTNPKKFSLKLNQVYLNQTYTIKIMTFNNLKNL